MKNLRKNLVILFCFGALQTGFTQISFSPNSGERGSSFSVTVTGTGTAFVATSSTFTTCVQIFSSPTTLQLTGVSVQSPTQLTGTLMIPSGHDVGVYDGRVYRGNGCAGTQYDCIDCFTIINPACLTVTSVASSGSGSLREAFGCAIDGDTIRFDPTLNGTTITLNLPVIANDKEVVLYSDLMNNITISSLHLMGNTLPFLSTTQPLTIRGVKLAGNAPEALILKIEPGGSIDIVDCEADLITIDKN